MFLFIYLMRRRRDDRRQLVTTGAALLDAEAFGPAADEALMPRWRRPSVQAARIASPYGETITRPPLKFTAPPVSGVERAAVQYRFVRVADSPDTFRSMELGRVDRGDEVEVLERRSGYAHVRAPDGLEGWVPRMSVAPVEPAD
jgi:hypothetical protein